MTGAAESGWRFARSLRAASCLGGLALLSACAGHAPPPSTAPQATAPALSPVQQAEALKALAKPNYAPPGPPSDPWGPYVQEAATRFDVPQPWIRQVMHVESADQQFRGDGTLTTSPVGAMGLMQLMPDTYREMQARYGLGPDPFEPHNNILAGTAYLREMYDAFGSPAFLAAYNAGPNRLSDYLANHRPLPDETRRYVHMIGSRIQGIWPQSRSPAEQIALNQIPVDVPPGLRWGRHHATTLYARSGQKHAGTQLAAAAPRAVPPPRVSAHPAPPAGAVEVAEAPDARGQHGLGLISSANAAERVNLGNGRVWAIQIGAYGDASQARMAATAASATAHGSATVAPLKTGHAILYRARLSGLTHTAAMQACQTLAHKNGGCMVVSPASQ